MDPEAGYRQWRENRAPRVAVDPSLDDEVRETLRAGPMELRAARGRPAQGAEPEPASLARGRGGRRAGSPGVDPFTLFSLIGFLVLVAGLTNLRGLFVALIVIGGVAVARRAVIRSSGRKERGRVRLAVQYADHYVLPEELDRDCADLLRRAQDAADSVLSSHVNAAGLIDTIDNAVTLPEEVWQIARRLARVSAMSAEHRRIVPRDLPYEVSAAFTPYDEALQAAFTALTERVRTLEDYAVQVYRADQVYQAFQRLEVLAERAPDYQDLVADTVSDGSAGPRIERLSDQAAHVREMFHQSVEEVRRTGAGLLTTGHDLSENPEDYRREPG
ncbi:hypothetical protein [Spongiactinospora sp. TRM90649]|uniref:hypothetical protein n=1 Tax=Spongiactinospora sp. TRM90649 TaxID=3031114 RepID=UPI0023F6E13F|nr:hypothetical protein [Spongiactinospora sp. TRM90649]MDF5758126.1 hypothetical protein [Spongiactinospora sp. TRM90649]